MKINLFIFFSTSILFFQTVTAQQGCNQALDAAQELFTQGIIEDIPQLLIPCIDSGFNSQQRIEAYQLLTLSYIFDDNQIAAERVMLEFLNRYPQYKLNGDEPFEFTHLFEQFKVIPAWSIGGGAGMNLSMVNVSEPFGVHNLNQSSASFDSYGTGLNVSFRVHRYLANNLEWIGELQLRQNRFTYNNTTFDFLRTSFTERQTVLELPLSISYTFFQTSNFRPFLRLGIAPAFTLRSIGTFENEYLDNSHFDQTGADVDILDFRNRFHLNAIAAGGIRLNLGAGYLNVDVAYYAGAFNQVNEETRMSESSEPLFRYFYIDDDFTLNNLVISASYVVPFYKAKKQSSLP